MRIEGCTIGKLSQLSGVSVRRIRFYSDAGLLPPAGRTESNYRIYLNSDVSKLKMIRALRVVGISMDMIRRILCDEISLTYALHARLETIEAVIASEQYVVAVLRMILELHVKTDKNNLENRRTMSGGLKYEKQNEVWHELATLLSDRHLTEAIEAGMVKMLNRDFDPAPHAAACERLLGRIRRAIGIGIEPSSADGAAIAREWLDLSAQLLQCRPGEDPAEWLRAQDRLHYARVLRYQQLLLALESGGPDDPAVAEWRWLTEAIGLLLEGPSPSAK